MDFLIPTTVTLAVIRKSTFSDMLEANINKLDAEALTQLNWDTW